MPSVRVIGPGRAGTAMLEALRRAGWQTHPPLGRGDDLSMAAVDVDLLIIATPDGAIAEVAASVVPQSSTVVIHLSGASGSDLVQPHPRRGALHPLTSMPDAVVGADRLGDRAWFAV